MLLDLDLNLFHWINQGLSSGILDAILIPMRNKFVWIPVYIFVISFALFNYKVKGYYFVVFLLITVGIADMLSNKGMKKTIERPRPCHVFQGSDINLKVKCGSGYSFTSNHAANHFTISVFLFLMLAGSAVHRYRWILIVWASLIAIAQVYVGVHYPSDVLCGAILGSVVAMLGVRTYRQFLSSFVKKYYKIN